MKKLNTGIFIVDGVEVLDFADPYEVFSRTRLVPGVESRRSVSAPFNMFTVARRQIRCTTNASHSLYPKCLNLLNLRQGRMVERVSKRWRPLLTFL